MDILDAFETFRKKKPDHVVHTWLRAEGGEGDAYSYAELWAAAGGVAALAAQHAGKPLILCYPPGLDFLVAFYGCLRASAVAVPACDAAWSFSAGVERRLLLVDTVRTPAHKAHPFLGGRRAAAPSQNNRT